MKDSARPVSRIAAPIRNLAQRFAYMGLVTAAFALMMLGKADIVLMERFRTQITDAVTPIIDVLSRPAASLSDMVAHLREMAALKRENSKLRTTNESLLQWQAAARRLESENRALRGLLNFTPGAHPRFITARIIVQGGGSFVQTMLINAGSNDGIRKGQAVLSGEGLVGRITDVGTRSARVLLVTDLNSRVPIIVESTRRRAILAGANTDLPHLNHLTAVKDTPLIDSAVSPGDRIVTSGHGGVFPLGLPVGVVASVSDGGIAVRPLVRADFLEYVRVADFGLSGILQLPPASRAGRTAVK